MSACAPCEMLRLNESGSVTLVVVRLIVILSGDTEDKVYLGNEPRRIREHMVVDVGVLHCHGPVLVVSVKNQSQSNREGHAEDVPCCHCGCRFLHQQPNDQNNTGVRQFKLASNVCQTIIRFSRSGYITPK